MAVIVKSTSIHEFCRVCFQASTQLTPCTTKLVYKDVSMTIIDVLNILSSPENVSWHFIFCCVGENIKKVF